MIVPTMDRRGAVQVEAERTAPPLSSAGDAAGRAALLSVSHLAKSYGSRQAVRDVTFELGPGITGLLGPNGAGKTTLMRCLAGLVGWDAGEVRVDGLDPGWDPAKVRRRIGYMPERVAFPGEMRLTDYLRFVARMKGVPREERGDAVELALRRADLEPARRRVLANLSKGYRQRVGLAQALLGDPPVVLLDEPTAGLDPLNVLETRDSLRAYARDRVVIVSTHVLPEARMLCDQVMVMSAGSLVYRGPAAGLAGAGRGPIQTRLRIRCPAGHTGDPPTVDTPGTTLLQGEGSAGEYRLLVDAASETAVGDLVTSLTSRRWSVIGVEPTTDALEYAFQDAVRAGAQRQTEGVTR